MGFSQVFFLLQQECFLTEGCLTTGLTALRNAHVGQKGRFYIAFFNLAIGLERLMKLSIVLDIMANNQLKALSGKEMKPFKHHDLMSLYSHVGAVAKRRALTNFIPLQADSMGHQILYFLSEFGDDTRYANLNALSGNVQGDDPLAKWSQIARQLLETEVSGRQRRNIQSQSVQIADVLRDSSLTIAHDLQRCPMTLENIFAEPRLHELAARNAVWHVVQLIAAIRAVLVDAGNSAISVNQAKTTKVMHIPVMNEFFTFAWLNKVWVMKKKKWP